MRRVAIVEVNLREGESQEKLLKRFLKKSKKEEVIKEHLEKMSFFKTKRQRRKEKQMRNKYLQNREKAKKRTTNFSF